MLPVHLNKGGKVTNKYGAVLNVSLSFDLGGERFTNGVWKGFAAELPDGFLSNIKGDDLIDYIGVWYSSVCRIYPNYLVPEPDGVVKIQQQ